MEVEISHCTKDAAILQVSYQLPARESNFIQLVTDDHGYDGKQSAADLDREGYFPPAVFHHKAELKFYNSKPSGILSGRSYAKYKKMHSECHIYQQELSEAVYGRECQSLYNFCAFVAFILADLQLFIALHPTFNRFEIWEHYKITFIGFTNLFSVTHFSTVWKCTVGFTKQWPVRR